jgi:hypothetical protein
MKYLPNWRTYWLQSASAALACNATARAGSAKITGSNHGKGRVPVAAVALAHRVQIAIRGTSRACHRALRRSLTRMGRGISSGAVTG